MSSWRRITVVCDGKAIHAYMVNWAHCAAQFTWMSSDNGTHGAAGAVDVKDEDVTWTHGHLAKDSERVRALVAAAALTHEAENVLDLVGP